MSRMQVRLVWKETLALSLLGGLVTGAIVVAAMLWIPDRNTQRAVGIGGMVLVMCLCAAFGGRWVRRLHDRRALAAR
jgi:hypothetical protein